MDFRFFITFLIGYICGIWTINGVFISQSQVLRFDGQLENKTETEITSTNKDYISSLPKCLVSGSTSKYFNISDFTGTSQIVSLDNITKTDAIYDMIGKDKKPQDVTDVYEIFDVSSKVQCAFMCMESDDCKSFIIKIEGFTGTCALSKKTYAAGDLKDTTGISSFNLDC